MTTRKHFGKLKPTQLASDWQNSLSGMTAVKWIRPTLPTKRVLCGPRKVKTYGGGVTILLVVACSAVWVKSAEQREQNHGGRSRLPPGRCRL